MAAHSDSAPLFLVFIGFSGMTCVPFKPWFFWGQPLVIHLNPVCVEEALITSLSDLILDFYTARRILKTLPLIACPFNLRAEFTAIHVGNR